MKKRIWVMGAIVAALAITLTAMPSHTATQQDPDATVNAKLHEMEARLASVKALPALQELQQVEPLVGPIEIETDDEPIVLGDNGASWLGVETHEVTGETVKTLKLPAERGVVIGKVTSDSPAAKAGLKENDVVTELNGQRVEGAAQFRRMIREIPAGRTVQLTVWRDGRAQQISVTLGKSEEARHRLFPKAAPGAFAFQMPEVQIPDLNFDGYGMMFGGRPRLGIDAEDLSGQLGTYFGAPDGEGVLVREVTPGSPAEKAGVKAGDVITSVNGERIRSIGDLREKLATKHEENRDNGATEKGTTVKLGVLRNHNELTLTAELPASERRARQFMTHRTNI